MSIQLEGLIKLGPVGGPLVDYSASITSLVINRQRNTVTQPATFANSREVEKASSLKETVTLNFFSSTAASSIWAELYDAIDTDDSEIEFEATLNDDAPGPNNPTFEGVFIVTSLDTGGTVGELRAQSQTFPVTEDGITRHHIDGS